MADHFRDRENNYETSGERDIIPESLITSQRESTCLSFLFFMDSFCCCCCFSVGITLCFARKGNEKWISDLPFLTSFSTWNYHSDDEGGMYRCTRWRGESRRSNVNDAVTWKKRERKWWRMGKNRELGPFSRLSYFSAHHESWGWMGLWACLSDSLLFSCWSSHLIKHAKACLIMRRIVRKG